MINLLETLYVVIIVSAIIGALAWVQSRSGGERAERYRRRMNRAFAVATVGALGAAVLYQLL